MSADLLAGRSAEELFGEIVGAFDLADRRGAAPLAVRAFNPTLQADGYALPGSVLETNTPDSPFLVDSVSAELDARGLDGAREDPPGDRRRARRRPAASPRVLPRPRDRCARVGDALRARAPPLERGADGALRPRARGPRRRPGRGARLPRDARARARDGRRPRAAAARYSADEVEEAVAFLDWLLRGQLPLPRLPRVRDRHRARCRSCPAPASASSPTRRRATTASRCRSMSIEPRLRERITGGDLLLVSKTNRFATVHRHERMDYVGVKHVGESGEILGELRLIGLFTSKAYAEPAGRVPILRRKLRQIIEAEDLIEGTHDYKAAVALYESFPKDDLFGAVGRRPAHRGDGAAPSRGAPPGQDVRAPRRRGPLGLDHHRPPPRPLQRRAAAAPARAAAGPLRRRVGRPVPLARRDRAARRASTSRCTSPARRPTWR